MESKHAILVLGPHRSGTSAHAGALEACGFFPGDKLAPPARDNEKGFFESSIIVNLNDSLLRLFGTTWKSFSYFDSAYKNIQRNHNFCVSSIRKALSDAGFLSKSLIVVKDPRLAFFAIQYVEALQKEGFTVSLLQVSRSIEASAASLRKRNNLSLVAAWTITTWYNEAISDVIYKHNIYNITIGTSDFDELVEFPITTIRRIITGLGIPVNVGFEEEKKIQKFIDTELKHH